MSKILGQASIQQSDVASAATLVLTGVTTSKIRITGTTTITAITMNANQLLFAEFAGALTLTHNATTLNLPAGGSNITTAARDRCILSADSSANVTVRHYTRQSGVPLVDWFDQAVKIASNPIFASVRVVAGLNLTDTGADNSLTLLCGENLTSTRSLTFVVSDVNRILTITGNPTIADWFNQGVKTTSTPSFTGLASTGNVAIAVSNASALTVTPNGGAIPSFSVDTSTANAATGIEVITPDDGGLGPQIRATSTTTNENLRLDSKGSGTLNLNATGTGAIVIGSGQVKFPAAQNASSDANTLDDYEEGTWTPALTFVTPGDLTVAYSIQAGNYTKIGRMVFWSFIIATSTFTHTTAASDLQITGLGITSANATVRYLGSISASGITKAGYTQINPQVNANTATINFPAWQSGAAISNVAAADMPTGGTVLLRASGVMIV